jgi:hypothetical protein
MRHTRKDKASFQYIQITNQETVMKTISYSSNEHDLKHVTSKATIHFSSIMCSYLLTGRIEYSTSMSDNNQANKEKEKMASKSRPAKYKKAPGAPR